MTCYVNAIKKSASNNERLNTVACEDYNSDKDNIESVYIVLLSLKCEVFSFIISEPSVSKTGPC